MNIARLTEKILTCIRLLNLFWGQNLPLECFLVLSIFQILPCCERDKNTCDFSRRLIKVDLMLCIHQHQTYYRFNCFPPLCSSGHSVLHLPSAGFPSHTTWSHHLDLYYSEDIFIQTFRMIPKIISALLFILLPPSICTSMCPCVSFYVPLLSIHYNSEKDIGLAFARL